jgi:Family of unknown function (DUF5313)
MTRPNPLLWIWYTFGGRLGLAYREWVLHDTTCRTRWLRQIVRVVVQVVLSEAVVLAVLGVTWIVSAAVGLGLLLALWYSLAFVDQTGGRRLVKNGYEPGTLKRVLRERYDREHGDQIVRYMQTYRKAA